MLDLHSDDFQKTLTLLHDRPQLKDQCTDQLQKQIQYLNPILNPSVELHLLLRSALRYPYKSSIAAKKLIITSKYLRP